MDDNLKYILTLPATEPQKKLNKNEFFSESGLLKILFVVSNVVQYRPKKRKK